LAEACVQAGDEVVGFSRSASERATDGVEAFAIDLLDAPAVLEGVRGLDPEVVYHLAALASVPASWERPGDTLVGNELATLNLLEAVRSGSSGARVVVVGSGEIYGPPETLPVTEDAPLSPQNPYAVSKAAVDLLAGMYASAHDLDIVRVRAFNHAGPRQSTDYVVSTLARQVAQGLEVGDDPIRVVTGNPEPRRDFTDVRDVVRAYRLLGGYSVTGAYNVCSGNAVSVAELLEMLRRIADRELDHVVDSARVRGHEVMEVRGSFERLREATGWGPEIPLERTLADAVAWWREQLAGE
jgi:GDP-4-dehydro-6-deoxy-D-mannose reductase